MPMRLRRIGESAQIGGKALPVTPRSVFPLLQRPVKQKIGMGLRCGLSRVLLLAGAGPFPTLFFCLSCEFRFAHCGLEGKATTTLHRVSAEELYRRMSRRDVPVLEFWASI